MIQSKRIFRDHSGYWDYGSPDELKYSKNPIFKHFFMKKHIDEKVLTLA
jgi:hypothetical protein